MCLSFKPTIKSEQNEDINAFVSQIKTTLDTWGNANFESDINKNKKIIISKTVLFAEQTFLSENLTF